ncbi:hypothetical protein B0H14DRAFT_587594 [Mycena olivaceomarginata]|nr:hypothetical protein B0H14DRAFT_587594 [Mycena olivaceomarginata]
MPLYPLNCALALQEQRISLFLSFRSVKLEWSDFDGMRSVRWCCNSSRPASPPLSAAPLPQTQLHTGTRDPIHPPALPLSPHANVHSYSYPAPAAPPYSYSSPPPAASEAFALLTNAHLVPFEKDATICVRRPSYSSPTSPHSTHAMAFPVSPHRYASAPTATQTYTSTLPPPTPPGMPPMVWSASSLPAPVHTSPTSGGKPRSSAREKGRSPVKGLFPFFLSSASSASAPQTTTPCPIRMSLPPLVSVDGDAPEEDNEDAWVDADDEGGDEDEEMTVVDDRDHAEDGDEELPTPVPWRSGLLAPHTPPTLSVNVHICAPPAYYESKGRGRSRRRPSRIRMNGRRRRRPTRRRSGRGRGKEQVGGKRKR